MSYRDTDNETIRAKVLSILITVLGVLAFGVSSLSVAAQPLEINWVLLSLVTILLVSRVDIGIPKRAGIITTSETFLFISILLYGTYPSVVLAGVDAAICKLLDRGKNKLVWFNVWVVSLAIFISGSVVTLVFGDAKFSSRDLPTLLLEAALLALLYYLLNAGIARACRRFKSEVVVLAADSRDSFLWTSLTHLGSATAACLIVRLIDLISFYSFIITVPILTIIYFTYKVYVDKVEASNRHAEQMADLHLKTIEALAIAIDAKDEVTHDHVHRVQIYATGLAKLFGLTEGEIEALKAGALLHDIGKLAVPDYILNKPGPLTTAEFERMKVHTVVGAEILERVGFPYPVVPVVRHHHERWDGRGYPDGLKGDQIPITARILTVSDSFDAMQEDRQYRKAMTREEAIQEVRAGSGKVFDPTVVGAFLDHLGEFEAQIRSQRVEVRMLPSRDEEDGEGGETPDTGSKVFERIRSAHREVITLYDIAQTIGTSLDLRDTFAVFSSRLEDIVNYTTCVLFLQRSDSTEVEAGHASGRNAERFKGLRIASGAGITGWVVANRHPMHNCDPRLDFDVLGIEMVEEYRSASVVPLIKDEEVLGALALYSDSLNCYDSDQLRLLEAVAKLASDAIANAVHHEMTEVSALTDLLTGLPNARALRYRFEEECDRAIRHKDTFAVVMMDLDGFKSVNDRLGHQAGDDLLRQGGELLTRLMRSSDFVSRYAGDEFVAILQVPADEAPELVSRIQVALDKHEYRYNGSIIYVGMSLGSASFGVEGDSFDELLLAADRAMYSNKLKRKSLLSDSIDPKASSLDQYRLM
ncbi:MAG TPA: diguanylate cyclase [Blastocatellia bacterium]|jgi:diguanylate cyclase (GGDEF)-like protein/putative nucleotidyltransferase with HDIG domain|nr:diguanylate cyclase [Blastocatellia bacterium]